MALLSDETVQLICGNIDGADSYHKLRLCWSNLNAFRKVSELCDVVIQCRQEVYHAHKCVLAAATPFFKTIFTSPYSSTGTDEHSIDFSQYTTHSVSLLLDCIYGDVQIDTADIAELLQLAEFVQYDWLVEKLVSVARDLIDKTNCYTWYEIGKASGVEKLITLAKSCIMSCYYDILAMERYQELLPDIQELVSVVEPVFTKEVCLGHTITVDIDESEMSVFDFSGNVDVESRSDDGLCNVSMMAPDLEHMELDRFQILSFFVHNRKLLSLSMYDECEPMYDEHGYTEPGTLRKDTKFQLSAYNHCHEVYDRLFLVEPLALLLKVYPNGGYTTKKSWQATPITIHSVHYDKLQSLFFVFTVKNSYDYTIIKFDLNQGCWYNNWIAVTAQSTSVTLCNSEHYGMILLDGFRIYNIGEFDFRNVSDNHAVLSVSSSYHMACAYIKKIDEDYETRSWETFTFKGDLYVALIFCQDITQMHVYCLNGDDMVWCERPSVPLKDGNLRLGKFFVCEGKLYFTALQKSGEGHRHDQYIYSFCIEDMTITKVEGVQLEPNVDVSVIPAYFFI